MQRKNHHRCLNEYVFSSVTTKNKIYDDTIAVSKIQYKKCASKVKFKAAV